MRHLIDDSLGSIFVQVCSLKQVTLIEVLLPLHWFGILVACQVLCVRTLNCFVGCTCIFFHGTAVVFSQRITGIWCKL